MREIIFRIWDSDQGTVLPVITMSYDEDGRQWFGFQRSKAGQEPASMEYCEAYNGDPTVSAMQFTGLHDKNGREIWEGDVVLYHFTGTPGRGTIKWQDRKARFVLRLPGGEREEYGIDKQDCYRRMEVIGNDHENLELLE